MGKDRKDFLEACRDGNHAKVSGTLATKKRPRTPLSFLHFGAGSWLASCKDINSGYTALHFASLRGHAEIVRTLLAFAEHNGSAHTNDTPLQLLTAKDRRGCLPLHLAAWNGHLDTVKVLLDPDLMCETVNAQNNARETPLHLASQLGHAKVASTLLQHHADPTPRNARGETALDLAARLGRASTVRLLVNHSPSLVLMAAAEVPPSPRLIRRDPPSSPVSRTSSNASNTVSGRIFVGPPCSPLHLAARNGQLEVVKILLDSGFDLNWITEEGSALHVASLFGKTNVVKHLLQKGIRIDHRDWQGRTVLEVLEEHENQKATDLTQMMQNQSAWAECKALITQGHNSTTRATPPRTAAEHRHIPQDPRQQNSGNYVNPDPRLKSESPIWQKLPESTSAHHKPTQEFLYHPPSIQAELVRGEVAGPMEPLEVDTGNDDPTSSISFTPSLSSPGSFREPLSLSPEPPPPVRPPRKKKACNYKAPVGYESLSTLKSTGYDNVAAEKPLWTRYDNLASNLLAYDNVPQPGEKRRWDHDCTAHNAYTASENLHDTTFQQPLMTSTPKLPVRAVERLSPILNREGSKRSQSPSQRSIIDETLELIDQSVSDFEKEEEKPKSVSFASPQLDSALEGLQLVRKEEAAGAPLAEPECSEDLGGSTTEGEACLDGSSPDEPDEGSPAKQPFSLMPQVPEGTMEEQIAALTTPDDSPPSAWASESKIYQAIYPMGLSVIGRPSSQPESPTEPPSSIKEQETQVEVSSSDSADSFCSCSEETDGANSSKRSSRILSESDSFVDPKVSAISTKTESSGETMFKSVVEEEDPVWKSLKASKSEEHLHENLIDEKLSRSVAGDLVKNHEKSPQPALDESAEWEKISEVVASFGGGMSSERNGEEIPPKPPSSPAARRIDEVAAALAETHPIATWLKSLGIEKAAAERVSGDLVRSGYDRIEFMKHTLTEEVLSSLIRDKSHRSLISEGLGQLPEWREEAKFSAHRYVSDWLLILGCQDYLGNFMRAGFDMIQRVASENWTQASLNTLVGISLPGHSKRVLRSMYWEESVRRRKASRKKTAEALNSLSIDSPDTEEVLKTSIILDSSTTEEEMDSSTGETWKQGEKPVVAAKRSQDSSSTKSNCSTEKTSESSASTSRPVISEAPKRLNGVGMVLLRNSAPPEVNETTDEEEDVKVEMEETSGYSWRHDPSELIHKNVSYSAHYLGSTLIVNPVGTEGPKQAILKLKKTIREIAKVPQVLLEISYKGVRVADSSGKVSGPRLCHYKCSPSQKNICEHLIHNIHCVCQDERDLNCFAYITKDGKRHFCHVFSVLTADVATEIILSLGQAFEVAYQLATKPNRLAV